MDDLDFSSMLYQEWSKTTHAEDAFWGQEPASEFFGSLGFDDAEEQTGFVVFYVQQDSPDTKEYVATFEHEQDAAWLTAVHGAFGDLMKRWQHALDDAERLECERDQVVSELAEAWLEIERLKAGRA